MAIYVNTNVSSLTGRNALSNVQNILSTTYTRLSTGLRINSAKDDSAGLQIADRLTTQINGLNQGNRNASDGIAFAQTAEGAMDEISSMLQKIRTLAVQSATGTNTAEDRGALSKEANALVEEITRIAKQSTYGGKLILDGADADKNAGKTTIYENTDAATAGNPPVQGKLTLQVGANSGDQISFDVANFKFGKLLTAANNDIPADVKNKATDTWKVVGDAVTLYLSKADASKNIISVMDVLIAQVDEQRADLVVDCI